MILYNVTVKVSPEIEVEWAIWMKEVHIPDVMNTGLFTEYKMCRLLEQDESDGKTFAIQYLCKSAEDFASYQKEFAPALQQDHKQRFGDKFIAFRTIMEVL